MSAKKPKIEESWSEALKDEFLAPYFSDLKIFLSEEKKIHTIFPKGSQIFSAFNHTPLPSVKAVILGQDPYHGEGQAHGLSFSVPDGVRQPPSLKNIFKELSEDLSIKSPVSGNLEKWAKQGVLLLNATLSVRNGEAGSHQGQGWERFTDQVIKTISDLRAGIVFLLWGKYAQDKIGLIDTDKHFILTAPHPSPFSVYRGFFGCKHFSKANSILMDNGLEPIDWKLTE
ncbi:MAG TPA: uracil-DNA glycosylase [Bacteroidales bacterium]|jgi:uracil-DNA glycosylase|nr:uracil-DNA glycosylase [Bacteroidales bacterium]|tara:strand:+ start:455 stop:1138 length:684 start_codon:yes stop_codon:yes gene_type:complete